MIGGIKNVKAKIDKELEFEKIFNELKNLIRKNEPGNIYYDLYHTLEPGKYIVMECYVDQTALDAHKNSSHGAIYFPKIRALLEKLDVEYFESVD